MRGFISVLVLVIMIRMGVMAGAAKVRHIGRVFAYPAGVEN